MDNILIWILLFIIIIAVCYGINNYLLIFPTHTNPISVNDLTNKLGGYRKKQKNTNVLKPKINLHLMNNNDINNTLKLSTSISSTPLPTSILKLKNLEKHPRSKSEQEIIDYLEYATGKKFPTAYPKWLVYKGSNLELDGYCEKLGIGVEFSGPQHTKWYPEKEEYTAYFNRIVRDMIKVRLCKKHGIKFFTVDSNLPRHHWKNYVLSRLADFGVVARPYEYIETQSVKPFRNKPLERELGLSEEYIAAKRMSV